MLRTFYIHTLHTSSQLKWSQETVTVMFSEDLARDVQGAELMITQHSELKAEIDTKEEKYVCMRD